MDVNEDADILHRLGILDSKLECPNKDFPANKKKSSPETRRTPAADNSGDGWSGLSLSELSSDEDESDTLFERSGRLMDTSSVASSQKQLRRPRYRQRPRFHRAAGATIPNCWKLIAVLSIAAFLGLSMPLQHAMPHFSGMGTAMNLHIFQMLFVHLLAAIVGTYFASFTMLKFNPFFIALTVMLLSLMFCTRLVQVETGISHGILLVFCGVQAFMAGAIERSILLLSPLWTARFQRTLFTAYAILAFSASSGFYLQQNSELSLGLASKLPSDFSFISGQPITQRRHKRAEPDPFNHKNSSAVPSFLELDEKVGKIGGIAQNKTKPVDGVKMAGNNATQAKVEAPIAVRNSTEIERSTEAEQPAGSGPIFKTKTEENAFRRKEVEMKKKKEKEDQQKQQITTTPSTTTAASTTTTSTTTTTTTTTTMTTKPPTSTVSVTTRSSEKKEESTSSAVAAENWKFPLPHIQLALLWALTLPLVLGFCCCCILDHPICSSQYGHLKELLSPPNAHSEPMSCRILTFLIWTLHFSMGSVFELTQAQMVAAEASILFWTIIGGSCVLLAICPSLALKTPFLHGLYFLLILFCFVHHYFLPFQALGVEIDIGLMALTNVLPLISYAWLCHTLKNGFLSVSARFVISKAFAKLAGPLAFTWLFGATEISAGQPGSMGSPMALFGIGTLAAGYALFLLLLAKLRRVGRQKQIQQLSGALNGKPSSSTAPSKRPKRRTPTKAKTKGAYSLLHGQQKKKSTPKNSEFPSYVITGLDSTSSSSLEDDGADLEMDSVGECCSEPREQRRNNQDGLIAEDLV